MHRVNTIHTSFSCAGNLKTCLRATDQTGEIVKILIISQYWAPENNIPARRWEWLAGLLTNAGYEVTVVAPPPLYQRNMSVKQWWKEQRKFSKRYPEEGNSGETIYRSPFFPAGLSLTQRAIAQAVVALGSILTFIKRTGGLRNYKPDLVIGTVPAIPTAAAAFILAKKFDVPYAIDLRDAWPDLLDEVGNWNKVTGVVSFRERILRHGPFHILSGLTRSMLYSALRNADSILVTSSYLANELKNRDAIKKRGQAPVIKTVRNVFPVKSRHRKNFAHRGKKPALNILYAGTLGRAQNLENALRAVEIARARGVDLTLRLVGTGVAREALVQYRDIHNLPVEIWPTHAAGDLSEHYEWADTALVHLTDWEALKQAVPSKTYELMELGIHICGVVEGETADLIISLGAGHVVEPEEPERLADLWQEIAKNRTILDVSPQAAEWVIEQREKCTPRKFLATISREQ